VRLRVLTWNLFHGRAVPAAGRELLTEFAAALAGWEWDVALLQEVPPWWSGPLASATAATERHVLTSRNGLLRVRRAVAVRWPDLIRSNGGGANVILVRGLEISEHRTARLRRLPERRWLHAVRLDGLWIANIHASGPDVDARRDCVRAGATLLRWAAGTPALLGGDLNLRAPAVPGFALAAGSGVDHFLVARLRVQGAVELPARGPLSDHRPVIVTVDNQP
jgi:endonuclease/exonuclease/phosphatase family metal-dependent hydrolase